MNKRPSTEIEQEYWQEVTYTCPTRGKVTQRVKVKRFRGQKAPDKPEFELDILKQEEEDDL